MLTRISSVGLGLVLSVAVGVIAFIGVGSASALQVDGGVLQYWNMPVEIVTTTDPEPSSPDDATSEVGADELDEQEPTDAGPSSEPELSEPPEPEPATETAPTPAPTPAEEAESVPAEAPPVDAAPAEELDGAARKSSATVSADPIQEHDGETSQEVAVGEPGTENPEPETSAS